MRPQGAGRRRSRGTAIFLQVPTFEASQNTHPCGVRTPFQAPTNDLSEKKGDVFVGLFEVARRMRSG